MEEKRVLLYGMEQYRSAFFSAVVEGKFEWLLTERPNTGELYRYVIDSYNVTLNRLIRTSLEKLTSLEAWQNFSKEWPNYLMKESKTLLLWDEYYQSMEKNPKNQLLSIFKEAMKAPKLLRDGCVICYKNEENKQINVWGVIKRGCKNGIDMAKDHPHVYIYFILDGIDMRAVFSKARAKKYDGKHTNRELRALFRKWADMKDKVIFIEENKEVAAPWIKGKYVRLWKKYNKQRINRLLAKKANEEKSNELQNSSGESQAKLAPNQPDVLPILIEEPQVKLRPIQPDALPILSEEPQAKLRPNQTDVSPILSEEQQEKRKPIQSDVSPIPSEKQQENMKTFQSNVSLTSSKNQQAKLKTFHSICSFSKQQAAKSKPKRKKIFRGHCICL
ncbi:hypothetical protein [Candidatus Enterococcus mangumiae]|uniref:Uncharacterized protein n=1 Tax=Candidatus Enterococcus mangumiae TaxID=2230878 RepID=A0ABZ2SUS3_9ENTE|nr:hypothetical protein [Enterococcus sp. DIV1094]MBO0488951.1 hypothetical protein [Enterococcus sp. DIV1094]